MKKKMKPFLRELFEYNHDCNQRLIMWFEENETGAPAKAMQLFNHIINAHQIWNNRIIPLQDLFAVWQEHNITELSTLDFESYSLSRAIIDKMELNAAISYRNSKGQVYENSVGDILFHISNHSTYHRGQIAVLLRDQDLEPVSTDYIFYKRYQYLNANI
jgi:uncharacterized damage-inducible protein DinB